jgi:hypothetical protein
MITLVTAVLVAGYLGWVFIGRYLERHPGEQPRDAAQSKRDDTFRRTYGGTAVRILQFYARDGSLTEGSSTVLCYGVLNARTVNIVPPVEGVSPALNRCVEIAPLKETRYTLTAEGEDGRSVSESLVVSLHADTEALPQITSFRVASHRTENGRQIYVLAFSAKNGDEVSIDPPVFPTLHGAPQGNFAVAPQKTTTYTLTAKGKFGHKAQKTLTVEIAHSPNQ